MIKSNRGMREIVPFDRIKPLHAEGRFCLDLTDPLTGKVKERVDGKNMVFPEQLFMEQLYMSQASLAYPWNVPGSSTGINAATLALNDDGTAASADFPYLRGKTIGYGQPSQGSSGTFRGAFNAANQVLGECSLTKQRWKFQYDFTTAQANSGTIRNVGLTGQYIQGTYGLTRHGLLPGNRRNVPDGTCNDGRYSVYIPYNSTTGIVTVYDQREDTRTDYNLSDTIGTSSAERKYIGYAPQTGKWYIYRHSSTAANRKVWVFTDQTFSNLETTYTITNVSIDHTYTTPFYVYGDTMYLLSATEGTTLFYIADFVANTAATTRAQFNVSRLGAVYAGQASGKQTIGTPEGIWMLSGNNNFIPCLYAPGSGAVLAAVCPISSSFTKYGTFYHPLLAGKHPSAVISANSTYTLTTLIGAYTTYVLPTPVTKTSANGMTVTYELEVFW